MITEQGLLPDIFLEEVRNWSLIQRALDPFQEDSHPLSGNESRGTSEVWNPQRFRQIPAIDPDLVVDGTFTFVGARRIEVERDPAVVAALIQHGPNRWMVDTTRA